MAYDANSILSTVKKKIGIEDEYTHWDPDIIMSINTSLATLYQIGVTKTAKVIDSKDNTWEEIIGNRTDLEMVKEYIALEVKLSFDPPSSSFLVDTIKQKIAELQWRINVTVDSDDTFVED